MLQKRINVAAIVLTILLIAGVGVPWIQHLREVARKTQSKNNLKQLGLALHNYADTYSGFPPGGIFDLEGRAYHGWMTSILPYLDASPFYNFVNFNEPWNSPENAGLFLHPNQNFENSGEPVVHRHWEFPVAHYSANSHVMAVNTFMKLDDIPRNEKLILAGELVGDFVPWGCPFNWRELNSINSQPLTFGRYSGDGCLFLFVDGHVDFVSNNVSKDVLKQMSGEDIAGFKVNPLNVQRPLEFPCPDDALYVSWSVDRSRSDKSLIVIRTDKDGNEKRRESEQ